MAVTKIIPIRVTIEKSVDYICNPAKTDGQFYIHSEHCVPQTATLTFQHHLSQARAGGNTIGRHLIQSFAPGEVSPEMAHEIGKRLASEILKGEYAYVLATHVDCGHIHNHFVWGAANVKTHKKYHSNKQSYHQIRDASDRLCEENNLSVIIPLGVGKSYIEYQADKQGASWKSKMKATIDTALSESADYDDFLNRMQSQGYEMKNGSHISFRAPDQQRFTRGKTLGENYTEDALKRRISEKESSKPHDKPEAAPIKNVINIEGNEKIKSSPSYKKWAEIFNLKQSVAAFNLIQQYGGVAAFDELYKDAIGEKITLSQKLNAADADIKMLSNLRNNLCAYGRTKDVWGQYQSLGAGRQKEKFYGDHKTDIDTHRAAKKALSTAEQPLPTTKTITTEIGRLQASKSDTQALYKENGVKLKEMDVIRKNIYNLTRQHKPQQHSKDTDLNI